MQKKAAVPKGRGAREKKSKTMEQSGNGPLVLIVRNDARKSGSTACDFSFLLAWLGEVQASKFINAVGRINHRYVSASPAYCLRKLLKFWSLLSVKRRWSAPAPTSDPDVLLRQMSSLRQEFFSHEYSRGVKLSSSANNWHYFGPFLRELISVKAVPRLAYDASCIAPPPARTVLMRHQDALVSQVTTGIEPKKFNRKSDSYNDDLFECISLVHSDAEYLHEYQVRLSLALETIQQCALKELSEFERLRIEGKELISATDYKALRNIFSTCIGRRSYRDPSNGLHIFDEADAHPNLIGNLLALVHHEMGGIPKPYDKTLTVDGKLVTITLQKGRHHWNYIERFGKTRLLPYLGVMTSTAAVACVVLIMIEHPRLTATSILRAELEDKGGQQTLLLPATFGSKERTRLIVKKPRAGEEKDVLLTPLSQRVMRFVLEWTAPVRAAMRADGNGEAAKKLWVGMHTIDYRFINFSEKTIVNSLRASEKHNSWGEQANRNRVVPFVRRHPELAPWAEKLTLKSLRVNAGVLIYLRTGGDLVATARAFGHKNIKTTISHYVPTQLRLAIYERQVRRHQNLLLAAAADTVSSALAWTDFRTIEELHKFLSSAFSCLGKGDEYDHPIASAIERFLSPSTQKCLKVDSVIEDSGRLILSRDPKALGVAILYREHLRPASSSFLDAPDVVTKVRPRFWCEFIDCISGDLPHALHEVKELVMAARKVASKLTNINFPPIK